MVAVPGKAQAFAVYTYIYIYFTFVYYELPIERYLQHLGGASLLCVRYLQQLRATASLVTGLCLAAYFYPEPVCVLPIPYPTYNLPLIVCKLYTQRVPMHSYTDTYINPVSFMLASSMYLQIRVCKCVYIYIPKHTYINIHKTHMCIYIYINIYIYITHIYIYFT